jgi:hypothetical protein
MIFSFRGKEMVAPIEQDNTRCRQEGPSVCKDRHISAAVLEEIVLSNLKRRLLTPERSGSVLQIGAARRLRVHPGKTHTQNG